MMSDFKNNPEITQNIEHFIDDGSEIKMSLIVSPWNVAHLTVRSVETWCMQDLPSNLWELIVIDDSSDDDVYESIHHAIGKINLRFLKLSHPHGMRGNTISYSTGFAWSRGEVLSETTGETMFPKEMMRRLYEPHLKHDRTFVSAKTYNLTYELQTVIDNCDWREDVSNVMLLPGFFNDWTLNNFKNTHFGTHQTCSIRKNVFYDLFPNGFPMLADYGSEDPMFVNKRKVGGVTDKTLMSPIAIHQHHLPFQYWMSKGKAPHFNKFAHTTSNYMNDKSGEIPEGGTRFIWDGGSDEQLSEQEILEWGKWDERMRAVGCKLV